MTKLAGLLLMTALIAPKSCQITFGGPPPPGQVSGFALGVPWFQQQGTLYCGAASIQMWAAYDHLTYSQNTIANAIGLDPASGVSRDAILAGVHQFTSSGLGSILDYPAGQGNPRALFDSAEITSMNSRVPVLAIVNGSLHAGVVDGGEWHMTDTGSLYVWDTVYFNDPQIAPDRTIFASDWDEYAAAHIITGSAVAAAASNYSQYGGSVVRRGSARDHNPPAI